MRSTYRGTVHRCVRRVSLLFAVDTLRPVVERVNIVSTVILVYRSFYLFLSVVNPQSASIL